MGKYRELDKLETIIDKMDPDLRKKVLKWVHLWNWYLSVEKGFIPSKYAKYNAGDIVTVNFGFNVGAELGGRHFAVVVEDNNRSDGTVMVTPLSSCSSEGEVRAPDVYLGIIEELNKLKEQDEESLHSFAKISQTRSVSKLRLSTPIKPTEEKLNLGSDLLEKIYAATNEKYLNAYPENTGIKVIDPKKE